MHCLPRRYGQTLIESVVAVGMLSTLIVLTGQAFSHAGRATGTAEHCLRANAAVHALECQLRQDLMRAAGDGLLIISQPGQGNPIAAEMLLLTATGHFVSQTDVAADGTPVTANAALIVYVPGRAAGQGQSRPLCRYVYLLSGSGSIPRTLAEVVVRADLDAIHAGWQQDPNPLDHSDVLGQSLDEVSRLTFMGAGANDPNGLRYRYLTPALEARPLNLAPASEDAPQAGGVRQLWPYVIGGVQSIRWEYCDGLAEDGRTPTAGPAEWFPPEHDAGIHRIGKRAYTVRQNHYGFLAVWDRNTNHLRPRALRCTLELAGPAPDSTAQTYQMVFGLTQ